MLGMGGAFRFNDELNIIFWSLVITVIPSVIFSRIGPNRFRLLSACAPTALIIVVISSLFIYEIMSDWSMNNKSKQVLKHNLEVYPELKKAILSISQDFVENTEEGTFDFITYDKRNNVLVIVHLSPDHRGFETYPVGIVNEKKLLLYSNDSDGKKFLSYKDKNGKTLYDFYQLSYDSSTSKDKAPYHLEQYPQNTPSFPE
jgi:hypothetical protein